MRKPVTLDTVYVHALSKHTENIKVGEDDDDGWMSPSE